MYNTANALKFGYMIMPLRLRFSMLRSHLIARKSFADTSSKKPIVRWITRIEKRLLLMKRLEKALRCLIFPLFHSTLGGAIISRYYKLVNQKCVFSISCDAFAENRFAWWLEMKKRVTKHYAAYELIIVLPKKKFVWYMHQSNMWITDAMSNVKKRTI